MLTSSQFHDFLTFILAKKTVDFTRLAPYASFPTKAMSTAYSIAVSLLVSAALPASLLAATVNGTSADAPEDNAVVSCDNLRGLDRALCRVKQRISDKGENVPECLPGERHTGNQRAYCIIKAKQERNANSGSRVRRRFTKKANRAEVIKKAKKVRPLSKREKLQKKKVTRSQLIRDKLQGSGITREEAKQKISERRALHMEVKQGRRQRAREFLHGRIEKNKEKMMDRVESAHERRARQRADARNKLIKRRASKKQAVKQRAKRRSSLENRRMRLRGTINKLRTGSQ